jgi:hypothetical protein
VSDSTTMRYCSSLHRYVWNPLGYTVPSLSIFDVAPSTDSDIARYDIVKKLPGSVLNIIWNQSLHTIDRVDHNTPHFLKLSSQRLICNQKR